MDKLLTPEEVADLLSVSLKTVGNWLRSGHLQGIKLGRLWRIPRPELERFLGTPAVTTCRHETSRMPHPVRGVVPRVAASIQDVGRP